MATLAEQVQGERMARIVLSMIAEGLLNKQIAYELGVSEARLAATRREQGRLIDAIEALNGYSATLAGDGAEFSTRLDESGYSQVKSRRTASSSMLPYTLSRTSMPFSISRSPLPSSLLARKVATSMIS